MVRMYYYFLMTKTFSIHILQIISTVQPKSKSGPAKRITPIYLKYSSVQLHHATARLTTKSNTLFRNQIDFEVVLAVRSLRTTALKTFAPCKHAERKFKSLPMAERRADKSPRRITSRRSLR